MVLRDTPREYFEEFPKATARVLDRYAAQDAFFKKVLESQRKFARTVLPYWVNNHRTNLFLAETGLKAR